MVPVNDAIDLFFFSISFFLQNFLPFWPFQLTGPAESEIRTRYLSLRALRRKPDSRERERERERKKERKIYSRHSVKCVST